MKTYSYDEAFAASLEYFGGDELAARVWVNKYAMKDSFGHIYECSPTDMHHRLAAELARIEQKLSNEKFVSKAPEAVVNAEREKAEKARTLIAKLDESAAAMRG